VEVAQREELEFSEDETNREVSFLRNRVRHELIPLLKRDYQPELDTMVRRAMEIIRAEAAASEETARDWLEQEHPDGFEKMPVAVQRQVVRIQLLRQGIKPHFELVEELRERSGPLVNVADGMYVCRGANGEVKTRAPKEAPFDDKAELEANLSEGSGSLNLTGTRIDWELKKRVPRNPGALHPVEGCEIFDADRVGGTVKLRHWRAGDRFQPIGMPEPVKLQDLFVNAKIRRGERHRLLVGVTASGEIFWVEGLRISERFKLDARTKRELWWNWQRITI
jgi:tRNA(Ile)-lysidine synthase